ncbi:hypothetical protein [Maritimibacter sp. 55A14]|uniref:hypothetical protein n=1 Tax=Maritimibacter sp. 55A14 TaxID=2174844 RepID=UPI0011B21178|nr:hypothetical protein [Maritimibacter sp. 55A14]
MRLAIKEKPVPVGDHDDGIPVFLVVERDSLIATDLIETIRAMGRCRVIHFRTLAELQGALPTLERITTAVLEARRETLVAMGLDQQLGMRGARVVLTIGDDDVSDYGWRVLKRPFSEKMIRESLA